MRTSGRRSPLASIPGYSQNAVLQLIVASATGYMIYHLIRIILLVVDMPASYFNTHFVPNLSLQNIDDFKSHVWVIFTYSWSHNGFWELFSNMVWLYCFGSIMQTLVSYKQVIPLFVYSLIIGGLFFELSQLIPGTAVSGYVLGAQAGVIGVAVAALTLAPNYRFYLAPTFSVPIAVLFIIFVVLMLMNTNLQPSLLFLAGGGALTGFVYVMLLRNGRQPGMWVYNMFDSLERMASPDEKVIRAKNNIRRNRVISLNEKEQSAQKKVDDILDKINQKGYNSLTQEEKDILLKASKDKDS